jgi:hypothetical protein
MLIELLNSQLCIFIFLKCYLTALSVVYTCVLKLFFRKKSFSANFPPVSVFSCEALRRFSS